ncbi:MAG TPA: hypothetical protein PKD85_13090 [Saprospiraceae bacterium]|nr:hypothetical protein [Saprospiraceae bacterium]
MKLSLEALKGMAVKTDVLAKITGGAKDKCHCQDLKGTGNGTPVKTTVCI